MKPIRNLTGYLGYKAILSDVNELIRYYKKNQDDVHNDDWQVQKAKKRLLMTKYLSLTGKHRQKLEIETASPQRINSAFRNAF